MHEDRGVDADDVGEEAGGTQGDCHRAVVARCGQGGLGDLILSGFRNNFFKAQIMTAALLCVGLALVLDLVLAGLGRLLTPWARGRAA